MRAPEGTSLQSTALIAERVARQIRDELPGVAPTTMTIGDTVSARPTWPASTSASSTRSEREATRSTSWTSCATRSSRASPRTCASTCRRSTQFNTGQSTASVQYGIYGPDLEQLAEYSDKIVERAEEGARRRRRRLEPHRRQAGVAGRHRSRKRGRPRRAGRRRRADAAAPRRRAQGVDATPRSGEDYDVRVRADRKFRSDERGLALMTVPSSTLRLGAAVGAS